MTGDGMTDDRKNRIAYLVGAGEFAQAYFHPDKEDLIIAVDGGYSVLQEQGIKPNLAVGDFDSLGFIPDDVEVIQHPVAKDDTDMLLAAKHAIAAGYRKVHIFGGVGGRLDHTIANIQLLTYLTGQGTEGYLYGKNFVMTAVSNETLSFAQGYAGIVSVFSLSERAEGIYLNGLKYPLTDAVLQYNISVGVSNEFIGKAAQINVQKGILLVMWYDNMDKELPNRWN